MIRRFLLVSLIVVFAPAIAVHAAVTLQIGDVVTFQGHAYHNHTDPLFEGYGGAFSWTINSVVPSSQSSPVGTAFQTFCAELQSSISRGTNYTISAILTPTTSGVINSSGNTLSNLEGIYLFDLWNNGLIPQNATNAGAIQVALWESEGYSSAAITGTGGISTYQLNVANMIIPTLLSIADISGSYSSEWTPTDVEAFELTTHNGHARKIKLFSFLLIMLSPKPKVARPSRSASLFGASAQVSRVRHLFAAADRSAGDGLRKAGGRSSK